VGGPPWSCAHSPSFAGAEFQLLRPSGIMGSRAANWWPWRPAIRASGRTAWLSTSTTSVVGYLIDLFTGREIATVVRLNGQQPGEPT